MIATHLRDIFMPHGRRRDDWDKDPIGNNTRKKAALSYCLDKAFSEMTKEREQPSEMTCQQPVKRFKQLKRFKPSLPSFKRFKQLLPPLMSFPLTQKWDSPILFII